MVTPIIAALFGSSYHLISGPTTAISIVMFSIKIAAPEVKPIITVCETKFTKVPNLAKPKAN
jgi:MFS superfamily sulfate permease-like transporter